MVFNVSVRGCKDKEVRKLVRDAATYYIQKLLPRRKKPLRLIVEVVSDLMKTERICGDTIADFEIDEYTVRIQQDFRDMYFMLSTLAHECCHVMQYARGRLKYCRDWNVTIWMGKRYVEEKMEYYDMPWEVDAHGRERGLFIRWAKARGYNKTMSWYKKLK